MSIPGFFKKKKKKKPAIRPVRFSLKLKMTILVFILILFTVGSISNFIINYENTILKNQLLDTLQVYLETFRRNVELFLFKNGDKEGLKRFIQSYQNIRNFKMAMYVNNNGVIMIGTENKNIGNNVEKENQQAFQNIYEDKIYIVEGSGKKIGSYEGFMPVYLPYMSIQTNDNMKIENFIDLYKSGRLFKNDQLNDELMNNLKFISDFDILFSEYFAVKPGESVLHNVSLPDSSEVSFLKKMNNDFENYKDGNEIALTNESIIQTVELMKKMGLSKEKAAGYLTYRDKGILFNHIELMNANVRSNLQFIYFLERYVLKYVDNFGNPSPEFDRLIEILNGSDTSLSKPGNSSNNIKPELTFSRDEYLEIFNGLLKLYQKFLDYRYEGLSMDRADIEKTFILLRKIYRIGTVRIDLDMEKILVDQKIVVNSTIDIALMVIMRILVITFLIVAGIISPINILSEGTDEITKGNLDKFLDIKTKDEIGQFADKFNIMSRSLKKAFEEVRDKSRMEEELKTAKEIQESILPKELPKIENYVFSAYYKPQTESGGDYYDFIPVDDSHFGIVVADVTGHGVGAGIVMAMLRSALRTYAVKRIDASRVIKDINPILFRDTLPTMFATVFYGVVDFIKHDMYYSIAGHNQGLIYNSQEGLIKIMKAGGMPVGMVESEVFDPAVELFKVHLNRGDIFIQYTDGITEAKSVSKEEYGEERLYAAIKKYAAAKLDDMRDCIISDVKKFTGEEPQSDDITLLIMKLQ